MFRCRIYSKTDKSGKTIYAELWDQPGVIELDELSKENGWEFRVVVEDEDKTAIKKFADVYIKMGPVNR